MNFDIEMRFFMSQADASLKYLRHAWDQKRF
jgi:hypothetical protein